LKIALCAPVDIHWLARFCGVSTDGIAPGLGSTATTPLTIELLKRGHEVTLYTLSNEWPREEAYVWGNLRIFVGRSRQFGQARNFFYPEISYLRRAIRQDRPAFVNAHWTYEFALGALGSGVPTVTTIHDLPWNVLRYFRDRARVIRLLMAYAVALRCSNYTAVSQDAGHHFTRYMRPGATVPVIANFLTESVLAVGTGPALHPRRPLVFATILQGWTRRKNPEAALKAFALVRKEMPECGLVMIGANYEPHGPAAQWARENSLDAGVTFAGLIPYAEMLVYVRGRVDAVVMPSLDEALSMTALEAMALGKPIVAGDSTPGMMEILDGGKAGLLVNVTRPQEIAQAMLLLQNDPDVYETFTDNAYRRAHTAYRAETIVPQYERMYSSFLAKHAV
jgi:glycosyltransferase involved in cell wall biosynthesis